MIFGYCYLICLNLSHTYLIILTLTIWTEKKFSYNKARSFLIERIFTKFYLRIFPKKKWKVAKDIKNLRIQICLYITNTNLKH